jgi:8-hydroxy-5-deazaflavin:NADPH oxidoreductase
MKIATIGRGNVGGGLAKLWRAAGHDVTELGHEGGDVSGSDAVLLAVPSGAIADALDAVRGIGSAPLTDATNVFRGGLPAGFASLAEFASRRPAAPWRRPSTPASRPSTSAFATPGDRRACSTPPTTRRCAVTEQLIRDAGYEPVSAGRVENARIVEDLVGVIVAVTQAGMGQHWYRFAPPEAF